MQCRGSATSKAIVVCVCLAAAAASVAATPSKDVIARVSAAVDRDADRLVRLYKDLHQHPELAFTDPSSATLRLNLRWFTREIRDQLLTRIDAVNRGVAIAAGVPEAQMPTRTMKGYAGPRVNDSAVTDLVNPALTALLGEGRVMTQFPAVMGSEDFQEVFHNHGTPYAFILIGIDGPGAGWGLFLQAGLSDPAVQRLTGTVSTGAFVAPVLSASVTVQSVVSNRKNRFVV